MRLATPSKFPPREVSEFPVFETQKTKRLPSL